MKKIGIIGVGHVGSTTAYTLIQQQVADEIILYDKNEGLVEAEVNDLLQGQIGQASTVGIKGNQLAELGHCDLLIFSAGNIQLLQGDTDRFEELDFTKKVVEEWAPKIKESGFNGILLSITNPCDVIVRYLQELTGLPKNQVFGTGTALDTVRMQQAIGTALKVHPNSVNGYVLGEHGETQFIAWSTIRIANQDLSTKLTATEQLALEEEARAAGWRIFMGKVYTCYGIANQATKIAKAILTNAQLILPVSSYSETEKIYIGQPSLIGNSGIIKAYNLTLSVAEKIKWDLSVQRIKEMYEAI
ncbi:MULTISPECIES: L-lactate dehydrogenase [unclassified Enterococcus]|uniref:lactate/malate family dehydrogenase n=1 Tax=unclassified Enterococcus TaxID=2608891 RepID=UPI0024771D11|nr:MULTISPECIES: L-lactate dehydrogenase [unclassified Enterococcus]